MDNCIAHERLIGVAKDGTRKTIEVKIGTPHDVFDQSDDEFEEWRCPVSVTPLHDGTCDIVGGSSLQSLCLALRFAQLLLQGFKDDGGRLQFPEGGDFPLEAHFIQPPACYN